MISDAPYVFQRTYSKGDFYDSVVVGLDLNSGEKEIMLGEVFENGSVLNDVYSGAEIEVKDGKVVIDSPFAIVLLERK